MSELCMIVSMFLQIYKITFVKANILGKITFKKVNVWKRFVIFIGENRIDPCNCRKMADCCFTFVTEESPELPYWASSGGLKKISGGLVYSRITGLCLFSFRWQNCSIIDGNIQTPGSLHKPRWDRPSGLLRGIVSWFQLTILSADLVTIRAVVSPWRLTGCWLYNNRTCSCRSWRGSGAIIRLCPTMRCVASKCLPINMINILSCADDHIGLRILFVVCQCVSCYIKSHYPRP